MYVNFVGKIRGASSACFFIFQNESELPDLFNFISVIQSLGSFIIPPLLSLHPQGLNNFKKYFKSCNKITSKKMGRGMEGSGIMKGVEKSEPLLPPTLHLDSA